MNIDAPPGNTAQQVAPNLPLLAHSANAQGAFHPLLDLLNRVGQLAAHFSAPWGDPYFVHLAGAWHDLGKARGEFQRQICVDREIVGSV